MEKSIITFSANEQNLQKTGGIGCYASDTVSYIEAQFALGDNWSGYDSIRAVWFNDYKTISTVLDSNGICIVPHEVLVSRGKVMVNLVGSVLVSDELSDRLTTFPCEALKVSAKAKISGSETAAVTPSQFEQFVASVRNDADRAEAGAESAEDSAEGALASAQAAAASALSASNSASDASNSADRVAQMVAEVIAEIEEFEGVTVTVETLPAGSQATSSFANGVLHLGIPKGDTGATGATGNGIESAVLNANYTLTLTFTDGTSYTTPSIRGATGATGATGNGISSVTLTSTSGAVKTYTIAFTDGTNTTFDVTDGEVTQAVLDEEITALKSAFDEIAEESTTAYDLAWINGSYLDNGVVKPYSGWRYTEYVLIGDAKSIAFTTTAQTSGAAIYNDWYDADKQYISSFSTFGTTLEVPQNAVYFRLSCRTTETNTASYNKIKVIGLDDKLNADSKQIVDLQTSVNEILYVSPNLINPVETSDGYYILKSGAISADYPNSFITEPIKIEKNVSYKANKTNIRIRIQNANGDLLAVFTEDTLPNTSGVFSYPADAFMIVTDSISNKNKLMVCKATEFPSAFEPYRHSLKLSVSESEIEQSPLNGKKVAWYGDSLIQNNWKDAVSLAFSMNATNCGVGGTKISGSDSASMCQASRINGLYPAQTDPNTGVVTQPVAVPSDAEVIIIGGGTNDWAQNVPLGEKQLQFSGSTIVEDVTTFYQACHCMFRRLSEERPNAKIIVLGTPFALYANRWTNTYGLLNNLGLSALDYGKALCDVARMWGYFALDYGEYMGINESNVASLLNPDSDGHLHPSTDTSKQMFARCCTQRLLTIKYLY